MDAEYKYTINYTKTALVFRAYAGVGIPLFKDSSLPFFKQYFGGGSNSMRGWPVRGIGRGGQKLAGFSNAFNDRTGDVQLEGNAEYRYDIARIIPNTLTLRGALFIDAGNIWNFKNAALPGMTDSSQFKIANLYKQLGVSAGTGFRLDFNYFILRIDLGFRFKRPELSYVNDGWKLPPLSLDDALKKIFTRGRNNEYRQWRYENFNLTIGISYPF
jgi:outer membrane protein assembly factor BamA